MAATTTAVRRSVAHEGRRLRHRILSIAHDAAFVRHVADVHAAQRGQPDGDGAGGGARRPFPVLANLRCGLWYARCAGVCSGTSYFKSTDGHAGTWNFSLRRLNLNVVALAASAGGVFLVDATKRGRLMPDAFARTVPIWCAVINRAAARLRAAKEDDGADTTSRGRRWWDTDLHTPPRVVSPEEHRIISRRLDALVDGLLAAEVLDRDWLLRTLGARPLRAFWITTDTHFVDNLPPDWSCGGLYSPVVCVSCSDPVDSEWRSSAAAVSSSSSSSSPPSPSPSPSPSDASACSYCYTQGAADDHEAWAQGLTPDLLWRHWEGLLAAAASGSAAACEAAVRAVVVHAGAAAEDDRADEVGGTALASQHGGSGGGTIPIVHIPGGGNFSWLGDAASPVAVGSRRSGRPPHCWKSFSSVVNCTMREYEGMGDMPGRYLHMPVREGKADKKTLIELLPLALGFVLIQLAHRRTVLIHCNQGVDRSVGVAIAVSALFLEGHGAKGLRTCPWVASCGASWRALLAFAGGDHHQAAAGPALDAAPAGHTAGPAWMDTAPAGKDGEVGEKEKEQAAAEAAALLRGPRGRDLLFAWVAALSGGGTDRGGGHGLRMQFTKGVLRSRLAEVVRWRAVADPSRKTMTKLSRFFTGRK